MAKVSEGCQETKSHSQVEKAYQLSMAQYILETIGWRMALLIKPVTHDLPLPLSFHFTELGADDW